MSGYFKLILDLGLRLEPNPDYVLNSKSSFESTLIKLHTYSIFGLKRLEHWGPI